MYWVNLLDGTQPEISEDEAQSIIDNDSDTYYGQPITGGPYSDDKDNDLGIGVPEA